MTKVENEAIGGMLGLTAEQICAHDAENEQAAAIVGEVLAYCQISQNDARELADLIVTRLAALAASPPKVESGVVELDDLTRLLEALANDCDSTEDWKDAAPTIRAAIAALATSKEVTEATQAMIDAGVKVMGGHNTDTEVDLIWTAMSAAQVGG